MDLSVGVWSGRIKAVLQRDCPASAPPTSADRLTPSSTSLLPSTQGDSGPLYLHSCAAALPLYDGLDSRGLEASKMTQ